MRFGAPKPLVIWAPNSTRPAQIWPCACVPDPNCARNRRVKDARRSVTGPLSDSDFGAVKARFLENETWRDITAPQTPVIVFEWIPPADLLTGEGREKSITVVCNKPRFYPGFTLGETREYNLLNLITPRYSLSLSRPAAYLLSYGSTAAVRRVAAREQVEHRAREERDERARE